MENFSCSHFTEWYNLADDVFSYTIAAIVVSSISIVPSIILNTAILVAIIRSTSLHTPQNIYMSNLAVSNIGLSSLGIPLSIAWKVLERYHHANELVCFFAYFSYTVCSFFCGAAFFMVTAATVDRYLALRLHLTYVTMVTNTRTVIVCMVFWVISLMFALLLLIGRMVYSLATSLGILLFMLVMGYCYLKIYHILRHHHNQMQSQMTSQPNHSSINISRYRKSVITLAYILAIYIVFYTPYLSSQAVIAFNGVSVPSLKLWSIGVLLLFVNSFVNPLFHCLKFEDVRIATWKAILLRMTTQTES
ncbi:adenosine receptor A2b-like [Actinia tenebrosa]|uniref:Adenosine receptor A2b-like n=1 Tax=Actinia tenebrosa TaxID=6105 RepID=A0A6P8IDV3_ACTTE|nr:adenosine receptor A2b-like [Actinia tenebrosa]